MYALYICYLAFGVVSKKSFGVFFQRSEIQIKKEIRKRSSNVVTSLFKSR